MMLGAGSLDLELAAPKVAGAWAAADPYQTATRSVPKTVDPSSPR